MPPFHSKNNHHQIQQTRKYHQLALDSFPFGKQSIKLSNYVSNQLYNKQHQDNNRILQQFRKKAIEDKFNNKYGHLKNRQRYITESMLPGVTLNPSIAENIQNQYNRKAYGREEGGIGDGYNNRNGEHRTMKTVDFGRRNCTQPICRQQVDSSSHLYNIRKPIYIPNYIQHQTIHNPQQNLRYSPIKQTIETQCQTSQPDPIITEDQKLLKRLLKKANSRLSKSSVKQMNKLEHMLKKVNKQIKQNQQHLHHVKQVNSKEQCEDFRINKSSYYGPYNQYKSLQSSGIDYIGDNIKNSRRINEDRQTTKLKNWKLNSQLLYNSTLQQFSSKDSARSAYKNKPKIQYNKRQKLPQYRQQLSVLFPQKDNIKSIKKHINSNVNCYENVLNTSDNKLMSIQKLNQVNNKKYDGAQRIRNHLKLLKKHSNRLQTINSYSLVE